MIVAGIGCRKGALADEVNTAIDAALSKVGPGAPALTALATARGKSGEPGLIEAASQRGLELVLVTPSALKAASNRTQSFSMRVQKLFGVPSIAEAAALAAAGPHAVLLCSRVIKGPVTCALAGEGPAS